MSILRDARVSDIHTPFDTLLPELPPASKRLLCVGLTGVVWLGVAIGLYLMFAGFSILGRKVPTPEVQATFTQWGRQLYHPERDIPIYILGCALTVLLCWGMARLWNRRVVTSPHYEVRDFVLSNAALNLVLAGGATFINPLWLTLVHHIIAHRIHSRAVELTLLLGLVGIELALYARGLRQEQRLQLPRLTRSLVPILERDEQAAMRCSSRLPVLAWNARDVLALLITCLVVFVPRPDILAGNIYQAEHFHHWDYFVMGPAIGYLHGQALCTQVYSQYGIGWPLLFALLNPIYRLSYGHVIQFANLYGCLYFCGVYLFLRLALNSRRWALGGALLAAYYKLFAWSGPWMVAWELPSNSVIRAPFDIWFLLALLLHQRTRRVSWMLLAGFLTGLSLLFETDTGIYVTFTFGIYCLLWSRNAARQESPLPPLIRTGRVAACWLLAAGVLLTGMGIASRGTLLQGAFWRGWIECFTAYPSGISMMPVADMVENLVLGMIMIGLYLFTLNYRFLRSLLLGVQNSADLPPSAAPDLAMTCVALFGTCTMLHFIGRSHPANLLVGSMGFALVLLYGLHRLAQMGGRVWQGRPLVQRVQHWGFPVIVLISLCYCLKNECFRHYPNLPRMLMVGARPEQMNLDWSHTQQRFIPEAGNFVIGDMHHRISRLSALPLYEGSDMLMPGEKAADVKNFNAIIADMRTLTAQGKRIAVIANDDTAYYLASGAPLWHKFSPLLPNLITQQQLEQTKRHLAAGTADVVFLTPHDASETFVSWHPLSTTDAWEALRDTVHAHYILDHTCGIFEVWRYERASRSLRAGR